MYSTVDVGSGSCRPYSCAPAFGPNRRISTEQCPCITTNDCFFSYYGTTLQASCSGADPATLTDGTCVAGTPTAAITYDQVSSTSYISPGCSAVSPYDTGSGCANAKCQGGGGAQCSCTSNTQCTGTWYRSLYTPVCSASLGFCVGAAPFTCASCASPSTCQAGVCIAPSASPSPSPASNIPPAGATADGAYIVDMWSTGSLGFSPSCDSSDKKLFSQTTNPSTCFGSIGLADRSGSVQLAQASFQLIPAANDRVALTVYSGPNCGTGGLTLGSTFVSDAQGTCVLGSENRFTLTGSPAGSRYEVSWRVNKNPNSAASKMVGVIVGAVLGGLLLLGLAVCLARRHMRAMQNKNLSTAQGVVFVQQQQQLQMQQGPFGYGGGAAGGMPPPPPPGAPLHHYQQQQAAPGGAFSYPAPYTQPYPQQVPPPPPGGPPPPRAM